MPSITAAGEASVLRAKSLSSHDWSVKCSFCLSDVILDDFMAYIRIFHLWWCRFKTVQSCNSLFFLNFWKSRSWQKKKKTPVYFLCVFMPYLHSWKKTHLSPVLCICAHKSVAFFWIHTWLFPCQTWCNFRISLLQLFSVLLLFFSPSILEALWILEDYICVRLLFAF